ncbi:acyl dehydratase [Saccharomonospora marina XMU15]|uniref:Acyl dehydratase n=1 Tax=Saccharomonospora marina XMU15 TaxID=882083 RepID=H5X9J4_9PSEU|nr:MaoC family dehydratase [Saccharomonospora marina]EHR50359.1 acyl dehydratase [Saccharomonospora marina XMU15]
MTAATTRVSFSEVKTLVGKELGQSDWIEVTQERINTFADATGDHQWIHVDEEKAKDGPFGATIAHGYLTLSLLIPLWTALLDVDGVSTKVNYGLNKVRFPSPVRAGSRVRLTGKLAQVEEVGGGGLQLTADLVVEIEGEDKPACVAQPVFRFYA